MSAPEDPVPLLSEHQQLSRQLAGAESRLMALLENIMSEQQSINAAVTALTGLVNDVQAETATLTTAVEGIRAYIAAHPDVDTSQLEALVTRVSGVQQNLDTAVAGAAQVLPPTA